MKRPNRRTLSYSTQHMTTMANALKASSQSGCRLLQHGTHRSEDLRSTSRALFITTAAPTAETVTMREQIATCHCSQYCNPTSSFPSAMTGGEMRRERGV